MVLLSFPAARDDAIQAGATLQASRWPEAAQCPAFAHGGPLPQGVARHTAKAAVEEDGLDGLHCFSTAPKTCQSAATAASPAMHRMKRLRWRKPAGAIAGRS